MTATAVILPSGETLGGYRIGEVIGVGGMSVVYRAEQLSLHREIALKVLSLELGKDEIFSERFRREGTHVARLDHPNVIPIYDAGEDKGRLFLAMRLVEGMTLAERMRAEPLSAEETLRILGPIADGLDAAHADGLVHRDIKPQNILLTERGHPYLTDFGVAKRVETAGLTATGGFVGSFHYAAPEQVLGTATSPATDIYALTAVLYQCLTGALPYARYTDAGVLFAQVNEPPPNSPLAEARGFNDVLGHGMAKDPADRYASAGGPDRRCGAIGPGAAGRVPASAPDFFRNPPSLWTKRTPQKNAVAGAVRHPALRPSCQTGDRTLPRGEGTSDACSSCQLVWRSSEAQSRGCCSAAADRRRLHRTSPKPARGDHLPHAVDQDAWSVRGLRGDAGWPRVRLGPDRARVGRVDPGRRSTRRLRRRSRWASAGPEDPVWASHVRKAHLANGSEVAVYSWTIVGGRAIDAWVIPTVRGDLAILCSAPVSATARPSGMRGDGGSRAREWGAAVGGWTRPCTRTLGAADRQRCRSESAHPGGHLSRASSSPSDCGDGDRTGRRTSRDVPEKTACALALRADDVSTRRRFRC